MKKLADTEGQEADNKGGSGSSLVNNDGGCRCSHEDYVSDDADNDSDVDGLISAQMGICHVATNQGHEITSQRQNKALWRARTWQTYAKNVLNKLIPCDAL
jgi:hypothetical protein